MTTLHNNMGSALSPYLQQHADNPVAWQEWNAGTLAFAREHDRPLFVSVGYSTCHWCHVMAADTFSSTAVADYLNEHFVPVKVDREERPDIDRYMMEFLVALSGQGGWPLNVFLSPDIKPIFALTYASVEPRYGMPGFVDILKKVHVHYEENRATLQEFPVQGADFRTQTQAEVPQLVERIHHAYDTEYGGFGSGQKFPPHTTLLFLLHTPEIDTDTQSQQVLRGTLDAMARGGLHDHLGGGFFRYCTDTQWTIPHFEKMLYDQALLLWNYSAAFQVLKEERYRRVARGIVACLERSFSVDSLLISAHDADTNHEEGVTYIWSDEELKAALSAPQLELAHSLFQLKPGGNFEGKHHLILQRFPEPGEEQQYAELTQALLEQRQRRPQPFADKKIVTSWNALAGCGLIAAYRYGVDDTALERADRLHAALKAAHYDQGRLLHSSLNGESTDFEFLDDYAAFAVFTSMLEEHHPGQHAELLGELVAGIERFRSERGWIGANNKDFIPIPENDYDSPVPSPGALAELALSRIHFQLGTQNQRRGTGYSRALIADFRNIVAMGDAGLRHEYKLTDNADFSQLPIYSICKHAEHNEYCFQGACRKLP
ncbi:MAG: thioredoxin domain-containing protein [Spirochaetaceae bacterium]|nr:MAG: thioredoxin domain-containing protein [Spirochaetaceae bacterium]